MTRIGSLAMALILVLSVSEGSSQGRRQAQSGVKPGEKAPTFKLEYLKDGKEFDLAANLGKKPTVLVFGSYT